MVLIYGDKDSRYEFTKNRADVIACENITSIGFKIPRRRLQIYNKGKRSIFKGTPCNIVWKDIVPGVLAEDCKCSSRQSRADTSLLGNCLLLSRDSKTEKTFRLPYGNELECIQWLVPIKMFLAMKETKQKSDLAMDSAMYHIFLDEQDRRRIHHGTNLKLLMRSHGGMEYLMINYWPGM